MPRLLPFLWHLPSLCLADGRLEWPAVAKDGCAWSRNISSQYMSKDQAEHVSCIYLFYLFVLSNLRFVLAMIHHVRHIIRYRGYRGSWPYSHTTETCETGGDWHPHRIGYEFNSIVPSLGERWNTGWFCMAEAWWIFMMCTTVWSCKQEHMELAKK